MDPGSRDNCRSGSLVGTKRVVTLVGRPPCGERNPSKMDGCHYRTSGSRDFGGWTSRTLSRGRDSSLVTKNTSPKGR